MTALAHAGGLLPVGLDELHRGHRLASTPRFVAINTALEVGLDGSVNVERVGNRLVAGIGGHADYCAAATQSEGGWRSSCCPLRTGSGRRSCRCRPSYPPRRRGCCGHRARPRRSAWPRRARAPTGAAGHRRPGPPRPARRGKPGDLEEAGRGMMSTATQLTLGRNSCPSRHSVRPRLRHRLGGCPATASPVAGRRRWLWSCRRPSGRGLAPDRRQRPAGAGSSS